MMFQTFDNVDPMCEHEWYQLPYAISALVEKCKICGGRRWTHNSSELAQNDQFDMVPHDVDVMKLHLEAAKEELGWNWASKLVNAKPGDIINIHGIKVQILRLPDQEGKNETL